MIVKYIEIPFKERGRDFEGCDCFGLVKLVLQNEFGIALPDPDYGGTQDVDQNARMVDIHKSTIKAVPVRDPQNGDIAVLIKGGAPGHIGIFIDGHILHTTRSHGTVCEKVGGPSLKETSIEGYYRVDG